MKPRRDPWLFAFAFLALGGADQCCACSGQPCGTPRLPFELTWAAEDPNGLPRNPYWGHQINTGFAAVPDSRALCPPFPDTDPARHLPGQRGEWDPVRWFTGDARCTTTPVTLDTAWSCQSAATTAITGSDVGGHLQFGPATYEGIVQWQDHSCGDDDYNLRLVRDDRALYTAASDWVLAEFDSDETIDHFTTAWWQRLHAAVDDDDGLWCAEPDEYGRTRPLVDGRRAIVIGQINLDCVHGCHPELHPAYAVAIQYLDAPGQQRWAFFARNWGNQGWCSRQDHQLVDRDGNPLRRISILLPPMGDDVALETDHELRTGFERRISLGADSFAAQVHRAPGGVLLELTLPAPENHGWIEGDLSFRWTAAPGDTVATAAAPLTAVAGEDDDPEAATHALLGRLAPADRARFRARTTVAIPDDQRGVLTLPAGPLPAYEALPHGAGVKARAVPDPFARSEGRRAALCELSGDTGPTCRQP